MQLDGSTELAEVLARCGELVEPINDKLTESGCKAGAGTTGETGASQLLTKQAQSEVGRLAEPSAVASARRPYQKLICARGRQRFFAVFSGVLPPGQPLEAAQGPLPAVARKQPLHRYIVEAQALTHFRAVTLAVTLRYMIVTPIRRNINDKAFLRGNDEC